jgi:MFS family permease
MLRTYPPVTTNQLTLDSGSAPLGFFVGVLVAGVTGSYLPFGWYFWIGCTLVFTTAIAAFFAIKSDRKISSSTTKIEMDWLGSALIISGLILTVFALTDGTHAPQKWSTPYIYITFIIGILTLCSAFYVEGWRSTQPLIPFDLFQIPYIKPLFLSLFFSYGCLGVFLLYTTLYMSSIMSASPVQIAAWFTPMCTGGVLLSVLGGYILHIIPGTFLVLFSCLGWIAAALLFALAPVGASFWAYVLPAMIGATVGMDITFNVANIFITTNLSAARQGLAGALMNSLLYLGIAVSLAFADIIQVEMFERGVVRLVGGKSGQHGEHGGGEEDEYLLLKKSYQAVFWYLLACAGVTLYIMLHFVRIPRAESDLTVEEKEALKEAARRDI